MALTAWDPNRKRRCRSQNPDDLTMQCQGEVTELTLHVEDHWHGTGSAVVRWPREGVANPERVKSWPGGNGSEPVQPFGGYDIGKRVLAEAGARHRQVGGDHYRSRKIQVWDVVDEYGLSYYAGLALKYLLRAGRKGSKLEDLEKCRHVLDKMIELEEKEE